MKLLNYNEIILSPLKNLSLDSSRLEKINYLIEVFSKLKKFYTYFAIVPVLVIGTIIYFMIDFVDTNKIINFLFPNLIKDSKFWWWFFWFLTIPFIALMPVFYVIFIFFEIRILQSNVKLLNYMRDNNIYNDKNIKKIFKSVKYCYAKTSKYKFVLQIKKIYLYISLFSILPPVLRIWIPDQEIIKLKQIIMSLDK